MSKQVFLLIAGLVYLLPSCTVEEIPELDFFTVKTQQAMRVNKDLLGRTLLLGRIDPDPNLVLPEIEDYGFFWSRDRELLEDPRPQVDPISLGIYELNCDSCFQQLSPPMEAGVEYYYRAYADSGERKMLGEIRSVSFTVFPRLELLERRNDTLALQATILNLDELDAFVEEFGIIIDTVPDNLTYEAAEHRISYGAIDKDTTFFTDFGRVRFNTTYYARPYYLTDAPKYGATSEIRVTDGWTRMDSLPTTLFNTAAVSWNGKGYLFGGQLNVAQEFSDNTYIFDPTPSSEGAWTVEALQFRIREAVAVIWEGEPLYGYGRLMTPGTSFWFNYPNTPRLDIPSTENFNGIGFKLSDKIYFGTGINVDSSFLNGFQELVREDGAVTVRDLAPVPVRVNGQDVDTLGRNGAVTFRLNGAQYLAGGSGPIFQYGDLQRFIPPTTDNPLGDWEVMDHELPGGERDEALAVNLNDERAFVGFGFRYNDGYLKDFWEYRPDLPERWVAAEGFPGLPREKAFAFALDGKIYVGGGTRRVIDLTQPDVIAPEYFQDFWQYTPTQDE